MSYLLSVGFLLRISLNSHPIVYFHVILRSWRMQGRASYSLSFSIYISTRTQLQILCIQLVVAGSVFISFSTWTSLSHLLTPCLIIPHPILLSHYTQHTHFHLHHHHQQQLPQYQPLYHPSRSFLIVILMRMTLRRPQAPLHPLRPVMATPQQTPAW